MELGVGQRYTTAIGTWRYHIPQVRRQCLCNGGVTSLCPHLVRDASGLSGPGCWGTVSLAHRLREDRLGAKIDTYISIFSTCQPENHLLLLPFSPAATAYACSDLCGARIPRFLTSRATAGVS